MKLNSYLNEPELSQKPEAEISRTKLKAKPGLNHNWTTVGTITDHKLRYGLNTLPEPN